MISAGRGRGLSEIVGFIFILAAIIIASALSHTFVNTTLESAAPLTGS